METKKIYKIKHYDGKYSTGGKRPYFTDSGKTWNSLRALKSHLTMVRQYVDRYNKVYAKNTLLVWPYDNCIVEEHDVEIKFNKSFPLEGL